MTTILLGAITLGKSSRFIRPSQSKPTLLRDNFGPNTLSTRTKRCRGMRTIAFFLGHNPPVKHRAASRGLPYQTRARQNPFSRFEPNPGDTHDSPKTRGPTRAREVLAARGFARESYSLPEPVQISIRSDILNSTDNRTSESQSNRCR